MYYVALWWLALASGEFCWIMLPFVCNSDIKEDTCRHSSEVADRISKSDSLHVEVFRLNSFVKNRLNFIGFIFIESFTNRGALDWA